MHRTVIEIVWNPVGWWEVRRDDGHVEARYISEFQAREAGRVLAQELQADLIVRPLDQPPVYEFFIQAGTLSQTRRQWTPRSSANPAAEHPLVLLVEDALESRELYAEYLDYAGFRVATAANGREALRLARLLHPDVILMDIRMPGMDGLEATADLKRDPAVSDIPVIAVTADVSPETSDRARRAGCVGFINKPALPEEVVEYISRVLDFPPAPVTSDSER